MQIAELKYTSQINIKGRSLSFNIRQKEEEEANSVLNFFFKYFSCLFVHIHEQKTCLGGACLIIYKKISANVRLDTK